MRIGGRLAAVLLGSLMAAPIAFAQPNPPMPEILTLPVNAFIVGGTSSVLEQDSIFSSPAALLGTPGEMARQLVGLAFQSVNRIWDDCAVRFEPQILAVVAAQRIALPGGQTLLQRRKEFRSYLQVLPRLANEALPSGMRVYRAINLFFVDALPNVQGLGSFPTTTEATISVVVWHSLGFIPSRTIAHEFGHNLGLVHVDEAEDRDNLMVTGGRGRRLTPVQCDQARLWAHALNRSSRPQILGLTAPEQVPLGEEFSITVVFRDLDRDLAFAVLQALTAEGTHESLEPQSRLVTPDVKGKAVGVFQVQARCREPGPQILQVVLLDELGESASGSLHVLCVPNGTQP